MALYIRQNSEWKQVSSTGFGAGTGDVTPIGTIALWSGSIADIPESHGWYICDGGTYGGVTTPDLRNKFVVGAGTDTQNVWGFDAESGAETFTNGQTSVGVGSTGGSVAHQLIIAEMPRHRHTQWSLTDDHDADGGGYEVWRDESTTDDYTGYAGGDDYHENRPPYYALAYIMKCVATGSGGDFGGDGVAGTDGQIQYNNNGVVGGASTFFYDDSNDRVGIGTDSPTTILELLSSASEVIRVGSGTNESAISFKHNNLDGGLVQVGSRDSYFTVWTKDGSNATSTRRFDITNTGAWLLGGTNGNSSSGYGQSGQVLTSNADGAPTWQDSTGSVDSITISQTNYSSSCTNPITTSGPTNGAIDIAIASTSNAYGTRRIQSSATAPTASDGCDGDIWYTPGSGSGSGGGSGGSGESLNLLKTTYKTEGADGQNTGTHTFQQNLKYVKVWATGGGGNSGGGSSGNPGGRGGASLTAYSIYTAAEAGTSASYYVGRGGHALATPTRIAEASTFNPNGTASELNSGYGEQGGNNGGPDGGVVLPQNYDLSFNNEDTDFGQGGAPSESYGGNRGYAGLIHIEEYYATSSSSSSSSGSNITPIQKLQRETFTIIRNSQTLQIPSNVTAVKLLMIGGGGAGFTATNLANGSTFWRGGVTSDVYQGIFNIADLTTNNQLTITIGDSGTANPSSQSPPSTPGQSTTIVGTEKTLVAPGGSTYGWYPQTSNVNYGIYPNNDVASSELTLIYDGQLAFWGDYGQGAITASITKDKGAVILWYTHSDSSSSSSSGGTDAGQGFFTNDITLTTNTTLPSNKNVGIFGPYTIGNNVTLTVPTGTTFTIV